MKEKLKHLAGLIDKAAIAIFGVGAGQAALEFINGKPISDEAEFAFVASLMLFVALEVLVFVILDALDHIDDDEEDTS